MSLRGLDHSLIVFPQLFWRVDQGGCVNGDSTLLAGDAGRQFACAGPSSCLPPAIANRQCEPCTPSCPSPCQHAGLPACLNHASFCQLPKVFPLPHHCTKAGWMSAASSISSNTSGAGSLHILIYFLAPLSLVPCTAWNGWRNVQRWWLNAEQKAKATTGRWL